MGLTHKTDKLDAQGLATLLRNGTLPEVWIPPGELRDQRELLRLRIFLVRLRTRVKNRIHGTLSRHKDRKRRSWPNFFAHTPQQTGVVHVHSKTKGRWRRFFT